MGRGGYNGGGPVARAPKKNDVDVFSDTQDTLDLPEDFQIFEAGEGLQNEWGGKQFEFGYLVSTEQVKTNSSTSKVFLRKVFFRKHKTKKNTSKRYRWFAASVLLKNYPLKVRAFHGQNPDASIPFDFELLEPTID